MLSKSHDGGGDLYLFESETEILVFSISHVCYKYYF